MRPLWLLLIAGTLLAMAPLAPAQEGSSTVDVRVLAQEGETCGDEGRLCFVLEETPPALREGAEVNLTLENQGNQTHDIHVTRSAKADGDHRDTRAGDAIASVEEVAPNQTAWTRFTVPDAEVLYLWCDVEGHEAQGMWVQLPVEKGSEQAPGPEQGGERVPGISVLGTAGVLVVSAMVVGRGCRGPGEGAGGSV